eukprot:5377320-Ditylum_brightwellii.AAC.1
MPSSPPVRVRPMIPLQYESGVIIWPKQIELHTVSSVHVSHAQNPTLYPDIALDDSILSEY